MSAPSEIAKTEESQLTQSHALPRVAHIQRQNDLVF